MFVTCWEERFFFFKWLALISSLKLGPFMKSIPFGIFHDSENFSSFKLTPYLIS